MKNNLGQPTISDVTTFFCDQCNAITCAGCPVGDVLKNEKATIERAQYLDILRQSRWVIDSLIGLESPDGGRSFPSKGLIEQARAVKTKLDGLK